jgi:hypothetical protein
MHFKSILTILLAVVPVIMATGDKSNNCKSHEFWFVISGFSPLVIDRYAFLRWKTKNCCLKKGGPSSPPSPPSNTQCPPSTHYWNTGLGCCAPRNPPTYNSPPPQCPNKWEWNPSTNQCKPCATPPSPPSHQPSPKPGYPNRNKHKREPFKPSRVFRCPSEMEACPVQGLTDNSESDNYECVDTSTELESCGGCTSLGNGQDCTNIEGAWNVGCEQGTCKGMFLLFYRFRNTTNTSDENSSLLQWRLQSRLRWPILHCPLSPLTQTFILSL